MDALWKFYDSNRDSYLKLTDEELQYLHSLLLDMLRDLTDFCKERGLVFYLGGGSMLGAVRHHGMVPWDDDIDLNMPRESFERLIREFPSWKPDKYELIAPGSANPGPYNFGKIKLKGTVLMEIIGDPEHPEVFLDIFPIEYASESRLLRRLFSFWAEALRNMSYPMFMTKSWKTSIKPGLKNCGFSTRLFMRLGYIAGRVLSVVPLEKWNALFNKTVQRRKTGWTAIPTAAHGYMGDIWPASYWEESVEMDFDGVPVLVSAHYDELLKKQYGDYMTPPPPEKRAGHYFLRIDLKGDGK